MQKSQGGACGLMRVRGQHSDHKKNEGGQDMKGGRNPEEVIRELGIKKKAQLGWNFGKGDKGGSYTLLLNKNPYKAGGGEVTEKGKGHVRKQVKTN